MNDKDKLTKTELPEENETVELDLDQLEQVAGGARGGRHTPPTNPDSSQTTGK